MKARVLGSLSVTAALAACLIAAGPPSASAVTHYHALLIANDESAPENEIIENALLNWDCWKNNGTISKEDNKTGSEIVARIGTWAQNIGEDDIALFYYTGHGGVKADANADENNSDPIMENDTSRDASGRLFLQDGIIGYDKDWKSDDEIRTALSAVNADAALFAVFDMCHANEMCLGTSDVDQGARTIVFTAVSEAQVTYFDGKWPYAISKVLFDLDEDGFAEADADKDGDVTGWEWFNATEVEYESIAGRVGLMCNQYEPAAFATVFTGLNSEKIPPSAPGGSDEKKGVDGCGVCGRPDRGDAPDGGEVCTGPSGDQPRFYQTSTGPNYNEWEQQWLGPVASDGGPRTDSDPVAATGCSANGDDLSGSRDEDGVHVAGNTMTVEVSVRYAEPRDVRLDAWWDVDDDGVFNPAAEHYIDSRVLYNGTTGGSLRDLAGTLEGEAVTHSFTYTLPFNPLEFYFRVRLTAFVDDTEEITPSWDYAGADGAYHGEVEDYAPAVTGVEEREWSWGTLKALYR